MVANQESTSIIAYMRAIPRLLGPRVKEYLLLFPVVALLGPRQVGKTTLARAVADAGRDGQKPGLYLDLENPID